MKKLLVSVASLALSVVPAAAAHADTATGITSSDNTGYTTDYSKDSSTNNSTEAYSSQNVKYEALYYVNYEANTVNWMSQQDSTTNKEQANQDYFRNMHDQFNNMSNSWMPQQQ